MNYFYRRGLILSPQIKFWFIRLILGPKFVPKLSPNKIRPNTPDSEANKLFTGWKRPDNQRRAERQTRAAEKSVQQGDKTPKCRRSIEETMTAQPGKQQSRTRARKSSLQNTSVLISVQVSSDVLTNLGRNRNSRSRVA